MYPSRVIYVGQSPAVLEWLCHHPRLNVLRAYCPPRGPHEGQLLTCALHYQVPLSWVSDGDALEADLPAGLDLAVCAFFERIPDRLLSKARLGWLNLHPAPLPERPGRYPSVEGVLEGDLLWGATLHWMTPALDGGPIIGVKRAPRAWTDGPAELEERGLKLGLSLLREHIDAILDGYSSCEPQPPRPPRRAARHRPSLELTRGPLQAWRTVKACEPFGGVPMRFEERLVFIREAQLTSDDAPLSDDWSALCRWSEPQPCALIARLESALCAEPLTSAELSAHSFSPWRLPKDALLTPLSAQERVAFTFE